MPRSIYQIYLAEINLLFDEMMVMSALY